VSIYLQPAILGVGTGPTTLRISGVPANSVVYWNGSPRTAAADTTNTGWLDIPLTAADLTSPSLAEISAFDGNTNSLLAAAWVPVGYTVAVQAAVYDPTRNVFYIGTGPTSKDSHFPANSVAVLNPATGAIGPVLSLNTPVFDLALSDDGSALYAALDSLSLVREINPAQLTAVGEFSYRPASTAGGTFGFVAPPAIAVMPGHPQTVALFYAPTPGYSNISLAIFDSGVKRANEMSPNDPEDALLFSADGQFLYVGDRTFFNSGGTMYRYSVDATGFPKQTPLAAKGGAPLTIIDGVLYTSRGTLIDTASMRVKTALPDGVSLAVDAANQRILTAWAASSQDSEYYPDVVQAWDLSTGQALGSVQFGSTFYFGYGEAPGWRLFRFGSDGVMLCDDTSLYLFHTALAAPAPSTVPAAVLNSASFQGGAIAPGEILSVFGDNLGPQTGQAFSVDVYGNVTPPGATQVWFNETAGTVIYTSSGQVNVIAPFELAAGSTVNLQVWNRGIPSPQAKLSVAAAAPALFTLDGSGKGQVVVINQDGSVDTPSPPGSIVALYGTGGGTTGGAVDGYVAWGADLLLASVQATIGGQNVAVAYAGAAPDLVNGVFQINLTIPGNAVSGSILPVKLTVGGQTSTQEATIAIR
jgi:uncharacterized protein (TIGR03437 family)